MASARRDLRTKGKEAPLPPTVDALIQLEAADQLEGVGRHDEAVVFAGNAVEEVPGHPQLLAWEERLVAGYHDPHFDVREFLFGTGRGDGDAEGSNEDRPGATGEDEHSHSS
jgi:hypothetical protein